MFIVYSEFLHNVAPVERWYYATATNSNRANEIALAMNDQAPDGIYYCVCHAEDAHDFGINNLPF